MLNTERELTPSWSLVRPSLDLVRQNSEAVIFIILLPALLLDFGSLIIASSRLTGLVIIIVGIIWRIFNISVSDYLQVKAASGKTVSVAECYRRGLRFWLRIVAFEILFGIMILIGLILVIVPGLIVLRRYYYTPFYIINKDMSIGAAMRASASDTLPVSGWVWGTFGVTFAFAILALLLTSIRYIGPLLAALVSLIYFFGTALRWREVSRAAGKKIK